MNGKKLYKIRNGAMLTGVCNGLAAYFDVDVSLVRLAVVLLTCFTGVGVIAYIACAVILPEMENSPYATGSSMNNANTYNTNNNYGVPPQDGGAAAQGGYNEAPQDRNGKDTI